MLFFGLGAVTLLAWAIGSQLLAIAHRKSSFGHWKSTFGAGPSEEGRHFQATLQYGSSDPPRRPTAACTPARAVVARECVAWRRRQPPSTPSPALAAASRQPRAAAQLQPALREANAESCASNSTHVYSCSCSWSTRVPNGVGERRRTVNDSTST